MKKQRTFFIVSVFLLIGVFVLPLAGVGSVKNINKKPGSTSILFKFVDGAYTTKVMNWISENNTNEKLPDGIEDQHRLLSQISEDIELPEKLELLFYYVREPKTGRLFPQDIMAVEKAMTLRKKDIRINFDKNNNLGIFIQMNSKGALEFKKVTGENLGIRLAVIIDNKIISAPLIKEQIAGGKAVISGAFSKDEARDLMDAMSNS